MAEENKDYGRPVEKLQEYENEVMWKLFPETHGKEIERRDLVIARNVGNPSAIHFLVSDAVNGEKYQFHARYYNTCPKTYHADIPPSKKDMLSYEFLREAGIEKVPKTVFLEKAPDWLFTQHIRGRTLRDVVSESDNNEGLFEAISKAIADFQVKATLKAKTLSEDERKIFWSRSIDEQATDYLEVYLGRAVEEAFIKEYSNLFGEALLGQDICHGDLSPDNIIVVEGEEKERYGVWFIDPELKLRNGFADLGSLISYLGDYENLWDRFAESFKSSKISLMIEAEGGKPTSVLGRKVRIGLDSEGKKKALFELYANVLHYSLRIVSKRKKRKEPPETYSPQIKNIRFVIESFINETDKFGLGKERVETIKELKKILLEERNYNSQKQ